jgi:hypothetical protein
MIKDNSLAHKFLAVHKIMKTKPKETTGPDGFKMNGRGVSSGLRIERPSPQNKYLQLEDDISSVAYWYQAEPHAPFPKLPGRDELTIPEQRVKKADKP